MSDPLRPERIDERKSTALLEVANRAGTFFPLHEGAARFRGFALVSKVGPTGGGAAAASALRICRISLAPSPEGMDFRQYF